MTETLYLKPLLQEIEETTDINGCFLLKATENRIVESTIPLTISQDILWEISILRDTFQQFANEMAHGTLKEIMLEGDKGLIFLHKLSRDFILLALTPQDVNLGYLRLSMLDIIDRINSKINGVSEEEINRLVAHCVELELAASKINANPVPMTAQRESVSQPVKPVSTPVASKVITPVNSVSVNTSPPSVPVNTALPKDVPVSQNIPAVVSGGDIASLVKSMSLKKVPSERTPILSQIFNLLKSESDSLIGSDLAKHLNLVKESILEIGGGGVVLFDISKSVRELQRLSCLFEPKDAATFKARIDNWAQRLMK